MIEINVNIYFRDNEDISILWSLPEWIDTDKYKPQENEIGMLELHTESKNTRKIFIHFIQL